jgi:large subunit ribosomal protein L3
MALNIGLLGKKIGMTQVFADDGESVPVTVIQTGPCQVLGTRTVERDGYSAIVLGFDEKKASAATKVSTSMPAAPTTRRRRVCGKALAALAST